MTKKLLFILLLFLPSLLHAQTSVTGRIMEGLAVAIPATCSPGDIYVSIDTFVESLCGPANTFVAFPSLTGNNNFSGTTTFTNFVDLSGGSCTVAGLQAAITAVTTAGGKVDATGCTTISTNITNSTGSIVIPPNVTVLLGPSTWTCTITTASTPCWNLQGTNAISGKLIGAGSGHTNSDQDPANNAALGVTNLICSGCGTTTDMIYAANPGPRTTLLGMMMNTPQVSGLWVNMGNSGREAFYLVSPNHGLFFDLSGFNGVCTSAPCGVFHFAAGLSGDTCCSQAYRNEVYNVHMQASASNSTGASCFFDGRYGEIAYGLGMTSFRCSGNITNGGGLYGLLLQAGTGSPVDSLDSLEFADGYAGNPVAGATSYGIRMEAPGNWDAVTTGRIFGVTFHNILIERIFSSATGVGIGCTSSGTSNGTGCGEIHLLNMGYNFANWGTVQDNLTTNTPMAHVAIMGVGESPNGGRANFYSTGSKFGGTLVPGFKDDSTWTPTANSQTARSFFSVPSISKGANTGLSYVHYMADISSGTYSGAGTLTSLVAYACNGSFGTIHTVSAVQSLCFQEQGSDPNSFDGPFMFTEAAAPPAGIVQSGVAVLYADSTQHQLRGSYNNGAFSNVPLVGIANVWANTQFFNSGTLVSSSAAGTDVGSNGNPFGSLWLAPAGGGSSNEYQFQPQTASGARVIKISDPGATSTLALLGGTLALGNTIATWNWAQTTDAQDAMTFGETSAATGGTLTNLLANQAELHASTASGSTATPLEVEQVGITATTGPPLAQFESTWNNASLVGQGIVENVTNTSSAVGSLLMNLRVGNVTGFSVDKGGVTSIGGVGLTSGTVNLLGTTSGTASLTGPAVAGTLTNPVVSSNALQLGVAGTAGGKLLLGGSTSGTATFTAPAVAGTVLNPVVSSNAIQTPGITVTNLLFNNTAPTIAGAGCGGSGATISANNGTAAFSIGTGTTPTSACTVTMPAATTGWVCDANTVSAITTTNFMVKQTGAVSTTSVVLTLFTDAAATQAYAGSDTIRVHCSAY